MMRYITLFILIGAVHLSIAQKFDGLAMTPPMGWNTWNKFACNVDEKLIRETADAMVSSGLRDAGYTYIVIDDCWHGDRDSLGFIHPHKERFPSGMKALTDYVHSKGLKFGIYSCAGDKTCAGKPGSRGHEYQDAIKYAEWGIDYLKYDWCNTEGLSAEGAYSTMRDAIYQAGRPMVFSLCEWGTYKPWEWGSSVGHLWRISGDIYPCFDCKYNHGDWFSWGVLQILDMRKGIRQYNGPDHWNDPDMMEVGNGMSVSEDRAHFTLWCMLAAPLMAGNDITTMSKETQNILTNTEAIAVDQDSLGIQAFLHKNTGGVDIWAKPLAKGDWAICFLNRTEKAIKVNFDWNKERIVDEIFKHSTSFEKSTYHIRNIWEKKDLGTTKTQFVAEIGGHDVILLRLVK